MTHSVFRQHQVRLLWHGVFAFNREVEKLNSANSGLVTTNQLKVGKVAIVASTRIWSGSVERVVIRSSVIRLLGSCQSDDVLKTSI